MKLYDFCIKQANVLIESVEQINDGIIACPNNIRDAMIKDWNDYYRALDSIVRLIEMAEKAAKLDETIQKQKDLGELASDPVFLELRKIASANDTDEALVSALMRVRGSVGDDKKSLPTLLRLLRIDTGIGIKEGADFIKKHFLNGESTDMSVDAQAFAFLARHVSNSSVLIPLIAEVSALVNGGNVLPAVQMLFKHGVPVSVGKEFIETFIQKKSQEG